jgi:hypothetical protein
MITRSPKTPCGGTRSESLCKYSVSRRSDCQRWGGITELYNEMLDPRRQCIQPVEDPIVLFVTTHSPKLSFRSNGDSVKKSYYLKLLIDPPAVQHENPSSRAERG